VDTSGGEGDKRGFETCDAFHADRLKATFKALAEHEFWGGCDIIGLGIIITVYSFVDILTFVMLICPKGKGYPDLATRRFLRACTNHISRSEYSTHLYHTQPPIFGLFDCDPDGINILDVYRHGSRNLSHESAYNVPQLTWLGLKPEDVLHSLHNDTSALHLTKRDRTKAAAMLRRPSMTDDRYGLGEACKTALHQMIMLNKKAEIQMLDERPEGMVEWLRKKIVDEMGRLS
jgi:DNA topoisomerase VI subunit A